MSQNTRIPHLGIKRQKLENHISWGPPVGKKL